MGDFPPHTVTVSLTLRSPVPDMARPPCRSASRRPLDASGLRCKPGCMADLLDDLAELRRRAREDRHAYPFPLLFFGVASFLAIPLYAPSSPTPRLVVSAIEWNPLLVLGANPVVRHPLALGLYWLGVLVVGALATAWWYRRRGAKIGIETSTRGYLGALAIGLSAPLVSSGLVWYLPRTAFGYWGQGWPRASA